MFIPVPITVTRQWSRTRRYRIERQFLLLAENQHHTQHQSKKLQPLSSSGSIISRPSRRNLAASAAMASQFIGLTILLTLNDPNHTKLRGLVADVIGQELTLSNGMFLNSDRFFLAL